MNHIVRLIAVTCLALGAVSCSHTGIGSADLGHRGPHVVRSIQQDASGTTLPVPFVAQPAYSNWCWAASGEMISAFLGERVEASQQVDERFDRLGMNAKSKRDTEFKKHVLGGWPELDRFGFDHDFSRAPLSWERINTELSVRKRPLAWAYGRGAQIGHMVVVVGCKTTPSGKRYLYTQNPNGSGSLDRISYESYSRSAGYGRHLRTYFNFQRDGQGA